MNQYCLEQCPSLCWISCTTTVCSTLFLHVLCTVCSASFKGGDSWWYVLKKLSEWAADWGAFSRKTATGSVWGEWLLRWGWEGGRWVERTPRCVFGPTFPLTWKAGMKSEGGCFKNSSLITGSIWIVTHTTEREKKQGGSGHCVITMYHNVHVFVIIFIGVSQLPFKSCMQSWT